MTPNRTNQDHEKLKEAAAEGLQVISSAADSASKVIVQSAADAVRVLTVAAADAARGLAAVAAEAARVVSTAAAVQTKVVDEKIGIDHEAIIKIGMGIDGIKEAIVRMEANSTILAQRVVDLESSRRSLNQLISIGIGILTLETGLIVWHLFQAKP